MACEVWTIQGCAEARDGHTEEGGRLTRATRTVMASLLPKARTQRRTASFRWASEWRLFKTDEAGVMLRPATANDAGRFGSYTRGGTRVGRGGGARCTICCWADRVGPEK